MTENIITLEKGQFLTDLPESLPSGRISKQTTGIGATQKEILDKSRNSIIVCPTRYLAATKAKKHENDLLIFYIGSDFPGIEVADIENIISRLNTGVRIKIMIVADSFVNHYDKLKNHLNKFFVMFDEIDSFQSESNYRPNMERCLEIYFKLKPSLRCMISATLQKSNYVRINKEPLNEIIVKNYSKPVIETIYTSGSIVKTAKEVITECYKIKAADEKIIVAFNSIIGITDIITLLDIDLQSQSGILCSYDNTIESEFVEHYYTEIEEAKLKKEITFMTCAFFAGIDIDEKAQVIIIADIAHDFSLLTFAKIYQIYGRPRLGATKKLFLFNVYAKSTEITIAFMKASIANKMQHIKKEKELIRLHETNKTALEIEDAVNKLIKVNHYRHVSLVRFEDNLFKENYLNVDYLLHRQFAINQIYSDPEATLKNMDEHFTVISSSTKDDQLTNKEKDDIAFKRKKHKEDKANRISLSKADVIFHTHYSFNPEADITRNNPEAQREQFLISIKSNKNIDIPNKIIIEENLYSFNLKLPGGFNDFNKYKLQIIANTADKRTSKLWKELKKKFREGGNYTSDEIKTKIDALLPIMMEQLRMIYQLKPKEGEATKLLNIFFRTKRIRKTLNNKTKSSIRIDGYRGIELIKTVK